MDNRRIIELLKGTIDPNLRQEAEENLESVSLKDNLTSLSETITTRPISWQPLG